MLWVVVQFTLIWNFYVLHFIGMWTFFVIWLWVTSKALTVYQKPCPALRPVHNMTLAPASHRERREFKIIFDNLIGWTLVNATLVTLEYNLFLFQRRRMLATLADAAGLVQSMTPNATLAPASYCEPAFTAHLQWDIRLVSWLDPIEALWRGNSECIIWFVPREPDSLRLLQECRWWTC